MNFAILIFGCLFTLIFSLCLIVFIFRLIKELLKTIKRAISQYRKDKKIYNEWKKDIK